MKHWTLKWAQYSFLVRTQRSALMAQAKRKDVPGLVKVGLRSPLVIYKSNALKPHIKLPYNYLQTFIQNKRLKIFYCFIHLKTPKSFICFKIKIVLSPGVIQIHLNYISWYYQARLQMVMEPRKVLDKLSQFLPSTVLFHIMSLSYLTLPTNNINNNVFVIII